MRHIKRPAYWFTTNFVMTNLLIRLVNQTALRDADSYAELPAEVRELMTETQYNMMTE